MNTLSKLATEAHGGLDRWNQLKSVKAHLSVTGAIWRVKGRPDVLKDIRIVLALREQLLTTHFIGQDKRFVFTPGRVAVEDEQGHLIGQRDDPRRAFEDQTIETPWDDLHIAYFDSYALWTMLNQDLTLSNITPLAVSCDAADLSRRKRWEYLLRPRTGQR